MLPKLGEIVIYRCEEKEKERNNHLEYAPAIITAVWGQTCINIRVLFDGLNIGWKTSAQYGPEEGQWIFPVKEPIEGDFNDKL